MGTRIAHASTLSYTGSPLSCSLLYPGLRNKEQSLGGEHWDREARRPLDIESYGWLYFLLLVSLPGMDSGIWVTTPETSRTNRWEMG